MQGEVNLRHRSSLLDGAEGIVQLVATVGTVASRSPVHVSEVGDDVRATWRVRPEAKKRVQS